MTHQYFSLQYAVESSQASYVLTLAHYIRVPSQLQTSHRNDEHNSTCNRYESERHSHRERRTRLCHRLACSSSLCNCGRRNTLPKEARMNISFQSFFVTRSLPMRVETLMTYCGRNKSSKRWTLLQLKCLQRAGSGLFFSVQCLATEVRESQFPLASSAKVGQFVILQQPFRT